MHKFQFAGREWRWPKFTTRVLNRLRDEFGLDLRLAVYGSKEDTDAAAKALANDEALITAFLGLFADGLDGLGRAAVEDLWDADANTAFREGLLESFFVHSQGPEKAARAIERVRAGGL